MRPRDVAFLGIGALVTPLAQILAARYAGRHFLAIVEKENS